MEAPVALDTRFVDKPLHEWWTPPELTTAEYGKPTPGSIEHQAVNNPKLKTKLFEARRRARGDLRAIEIWLHGDCQSGYQHF